MRLSRGGNRTINTALHMAAVTQVRLGREGASYYEKLTGAGKTRTEALRLLRRRISDRVYAAQCTDETLADAGDPAPPEPVELRAERQSPNLTLAAA